MQANPFIFRRSARLPLYVLSAMLVATAIPGCKKSEKDSTSVTPHSIKTSSIETSSIETSAPDDAGFTPPTQATRDINAKFVGLLDHFDPADFDDAMQGLIESDPNIRIETVGGKKWSRQAFDFVKGDAPDSVNPSLWRQAKLNGNVGLFKVVEGIYQVRGYDVSNMSWIRGKSGWIIVDPLTSVESASAAVALARKHLGNDPVVAVIFTHSHIDHFAGVDAVLPSSGAEQVRIVAPRGFVEEASSENILAGTAMSRRASYQFGFQLPVSERGYVDSGLGKRPLAGTSSFKVPTDLVYETPQVMDIDGVRFEFQYTPDSEAPAELAFYLPEMKAYCGAEIVNRTLHNLYTLRGAKVRDGLKWSNYIDDAINRFGGADVAFMSHTWPVFGHERAIKFLQGQRDTYRYIHDQTLHWANKGETPLEIAEHLALPPSLANQAANRGYYGSVSHNVKAVYQYYFGWYDGNPANLNPLPPVELGKKYIEAMGGAENVKKTAKTAIENGDYRWAATLLNHLLFSNEKDEEARELQARTYDQLGYQSESGVWRSEYLSASHELRHGISDHSVSVHTMNGIISVVPLDMFFSAMATRLNAEKAIERDPASYNFVFTDLNETYVLSLENGVLHHRKRPADTHAVTTVRLTHDLFLKLATQQLGLKELIFSDDLAVEGSRMELLSFFMLLDKIDPNFTIVTP